MPHPVPPHRRTDPLAELCELTIVEGLAMGVDPEALLRATGEAFEFLLARPPARPASLAVERSRASNR